MLGDLCLSAMSSQRARYRGRKWVAVTAIRSADSFEDRFPRCCRLFAVRIKRDTGNLVRELNGMAAESPTGNVPGNQPILRRNIVGPLYGTDRA